MTKLFSVIDNKFFSILSAPSRVLYLDCIFEIYQRVDELEGEQKNTKEKIVDEIEYLLDSRESEVILEEDAKDFVDTRSKARYIVNHIRDCGWLYEEDLGHNVVLINFKTEAAKVVRLLHEIEANTRLEHTGFIKSIYLLTQDLASAKESDAIAQIEQMHKQTDELIAGLKSLKSTIFSYYNNMVKKAIFENAGVILDELMRYKDSFFDKAFYHLSTYDNLDKYKDVILNEIAKIRTNETFMAELSSERLDDTYPTIEAAHEFVAGRLDYVSDSFNSVDRLINTINNKNNKYIQAAISKVMFFINRADDFEGIFNRLVEVINQGRLEYGKDYAFNLFSSKNLDKNSLWTARESNRAKAELEKIVVSGLDANLADERIKEMMRYKEFSFTEINKYAQRLLQGRVRIRASEIPNNDSREFIKIVLLYLYSRSFGCKYKITATTVAVTKHGVTFNDFIMEAIQE